MNQNASHWKHCLEHAVVSDVGLRRRNNQDSQVVVLADGERTWQQRGHVFVVADGMGAHAAGELASKLAVDNVPLTYGKLRNRPPHEALRDAVLDANTQIHNRGQASEDFRGMGTTISSLVLLPEGAMIGHVGDSRVYRLRDHVLEQLTFDHSLVWEVCAAEGISESEAPSYIPRNVITRSAGPNPEVQVDLEGLYPLEVGDTFLLCSDGLSGLVFDRELGTILGCLPLEEALQTMVDLAILRGGPDNITGIAVRVTGSECIGAADGRSVLHNNGFQPRVRSRSWVIAAVLMLAALGLIGLAATGNVVAAVAGLVGVAAIVLAALMVRHSDPDETQVFFDPQRLGKGPYTSCECAPDESFVEHLAQLLTELRATAEGRSWNVDWEKVGEFVGRAKDAAEADDYGESIRQYCRAISFVTGQLRNLPSRKGPEEDAGWIPDAG